MLAGFRGGARMAAEGQEALAKEYCWCEYGAAVAVTLHLSLSNLRMHPCQFRGSYFKRRKRFLQS